MILNRGLLEQMYSSIRRFVSLRVIKMFMIKSVKKLNLSKHCQLTFVALNDHQHDSNDQPKSHGKLCLRFDLVNN